MKIGKLRTKLIIKRKVAEPDGAGGITETWEEFATVYGRQSVRRAWEASKDDQLSSMLNINWETRFVRGITPQMRVYVDGRELEILAVYDPSQKCERLMIVTRELQNQGV